LTSKRENMASIRNITLASLLLLANAAWADVVGPETLALGLVGIALFGAGVILVGFGAWYLLKRFVVKGAKKQGGKK
jgi:hypothetical protein